MTKLQRIENFLVALMMILAAVLTILLSEEGYRFVTDLIWIMMLLAAVRELVYYFTMAKHMTGGKIFLFRAVLYCDLVIFTYAVSDIPRSYILLYLSVLFGFSGVVDILRALEARRTGAPSWRFNLIQGIFNTVLAVVCIRFMSTGRLAEIIFGFSLLNAGLMRMVSAFRRTAVIYIS